MFCDDPEGLRHRRLIQITEQRALQDDAALHLLDTEELQALVAHEVGHEYFWDEYSPARRDNSQSSLRRLELLCDGFAVVTLQRVGLNPSG